jgi:hypothetical protein
MISTRILALYSSGNKPHALLFVSGILVKRYACYDRKLFCNIISYFSAKVHDIYLGLVHNTERLSSPTHCIIIDKQWLVIQLIKSNFSSITEMIAGGTFETCKAFFDQVLFNSAGMNIQGF